MKKIPKAMDILLSDTDFEKIMSCSSSPQDVISFDLENENDRTVLEFLSHFRIPQIDKLFIKFGNF